MRWLSMRKFLKLIGASFIIFIIFKLGAYLVGDGVADGLMSAIFAVIILGMWDYKKEAIEGLTDSIKRTEKMFREARDRNTKMAEALQYIATGKGSEDLAVKVLREAYAKKD